MRSRCWAARANARSTPNRSPRWRAPFRTTSFAASALGYGGSTCREWAVGNRIAKGNLFWHRQCVNPVIEWKPDELTVAQTTTQGSAEADSYARACPDGHHPPA